MGFVEDMRAAASPAMADRAARVAEEVLHMEAKLAETRREMGQTKLVIAYDNGGGQTGIRKNPVYEAYNALLRSYLSALDQLARMTNSAPQAAPQTPAQTATGDSLDRMRRKFRAVSGGRAS